MLQDYLLERHGYAEASEAYCCGQLEDGLDLRMRDGQIPHRLIERIEGRIEYRRGERMIDRMTGQRATVESGPPPLQ
jgi:hypothetical protein